MLRAPDVVLLLCLCGAAEALYKQWIPDTNYENRTNWDKGDVPCGSDTVQFPAQRKVSVFVETTHAVKEMRLPIDGEFILNSDSGFYVVDGPEPGCGAGVTAHFTDSQPQWLNPALWRVASTLNDLELGKFLFAVHEETVPCVHDNVAFKELSSFRVDTSVSQPIIPVSAVYLMGRIFEIRAVFSEYLKSRTGQLQFQGSSVVTVGSPGCGDPSGCECGNSVYHQEICSTVTCGSLDCKKPLLPAGHCCGICGTILTIQYSSGFNLQTYRERINHLFLIKPQYKSIQLGMSKVQQSERLMGVIPFATSPAIQVVILDGNNGKQTESLAWELTEDARVHGASLGISEVEFHTSSGSSSSQSGGNTGMVVGIVVGVLLVLAFVTIMVVLVQRRVFRMPPMPSLIIFRSNGEIGDLGGPIDRGFDNPMFDKPTTLPGMPGPYESGGNRSIALTHSGVHFVNPVYDENETDFNA